LVFAQQEPHLNNYQNLNLRLKAWDNYCKALKDRENYSLLADKADIGIKLAQNNPSYLCLFYFYKGYGYEYTNNQYENATNYYEKSLKIAQQIKDLKQETLALMRLNYMYYSLKEKQKSNMLIRYIKNIVDTVKDQNTKAILLGSIGEYYLDNSEFENFINYKIKAIDYLLLDQKKDSLALNNIGVSYLQIADAYNSMQQFNKAIEYCKYAEPYLNKMDGIAFLHNSFIEAYTNIDQIYQAQEHYRYLYQLLNNKGLLDLNLSYANRNMAEFYLVKKRLRLANDYADKALFFAKKSQDEEIEMEANLIKGKVLLEQNKYKTAIEKLNLALDYSYVYDKKQFSDINKNLSQAYAAQQDWKKAYYYQNIYTLINDSLSVESAKQSLANAEAKFQNKIKQQEIKSLSAENIIHEINIKNGKKQKIFLISGLISIAIMGSLLYYQSRNRKIINNKLSLVNTELDKANKTKIQFFGILNHDLRSPVARLIHFINLKRDAPDLLDDLHREELEESTHRSAEQLLEQMEDLLLWSKGQMERFYPEKKIVSVDYIFKDIQNNFSEDNINLILENPENLEIFTDLEYLKTIIRNLTNNAIKVLKNTENAHIIWKAISNEKYIELIIIDNGNGASLEKFRAFYDDNISIGIKSGLGMHLIRDLSKAINAEIVVESIIGAGTTIKIKIEKF